MDYVEYYSDMLIPNTFFKLNSKQPNLYEITNVLKEKDNRTIISKINQNEGKNIYSKLSIQDMQDIIYTRIIVSSIGSFLCLICIILYIIIFIRKRCLKIKSFVDDKANNSPETLNPIDNKLGEKLLAEKSNYENSEDESGENNKIRISDLNNTKNYFRNSTSNYYENRFFKESNTYINAYNFNNNNNQLSNNNEKVQNPFILKDEISKDPTASSLDYHRKTTNTIAVKNKKNLLRDSEELNKELGYYRVSEPVYKGKTNKDYNSARISKIQEFNFNDKSKTNESSNDNFLITFNENSKNNYNDSSKDEINNNNNNNMNNNLNLIGTNYLFVNKIKFYENEDLIDPKKDILQNVYEKNFLHQGLLNRNSKHRTFSNNNNENRNTDAKAESSREAISECKPSTSINNKDENSNFLNYSNANSSNNNLFNNSNLQNSIKNISKKIKKVPSYNHIANCSNAKLNKANSKKNGDSESKSIFEYKENAVITNSNNNSRDNNNNYNYISSNLISYKKNETILAQSDSDEFKKHIHGTSENDDEFSHASENSITNNTVVRNHKPKELKMGMINDILVMLIFSNLGFLSSSFLVSKTEKLDKSNYMCEAQGLLQNYFDLASICWTTVVSNVMKNMIISINIDSEKKKFKWYFSYCLILPLIFCMGPMITNSYGPSGPWCWIQNPCGKHESKLSKEDIWIYIMYTFMWLHILIICSHFYKIIKYFTKRLREIRNQNREDEKKFIKKNKMILYCFPIILILSKTPATINRVMFIFFSFESLILFHLQAAFSPLIGILNSFVFIHIHAAFLKEKKVRKIESIKDAIGRSSDL